MSIQRHVLNVVLTLVIVRGHCLPLAKGDVLEDEEPAATVVESARPNFGPLPGHVTGILAQGVSSVLRSEGRSGPQDVSGFSVDRHSYRWLYVPAINKMTGDTVQVLVGDKGQERKKFNSVQLATAGTAATNGLPDEPYRLVQVQVNGGLGSPETDRFVATELRVLDKTSNVPLDVMKSVRDARKRFANALERKNSSLAKQMAAVRRDALGDGAPAEDANTKIYEFVTWLPEHERLLIQFTHRVTEGRYQSTTGTSFRGPKPFGLKPIPIDKPAEIRYGTEYGVSQLIECEYDYSGEFVRLTEKPLRTFVNKLDLPK